MLSSLVLGGRTESASIDRSQSAEGVHGVRILCSGLGKIGPGPNRSYKDVKKKCGGMAYIEIHHKTPVAKGGTNAFENLITLCSRHHSYAHDLHLR